MSIDFSKKRSAEQLAREIVNDSTILVRRVEMEGLAWQYLQLLKVRSAPSEKAPTFSEFIRNASPEEKEAVYSEVMKAATSRQAAVAAPDDKKSGMLTREQIEAWRDVLKRYYQGPWIGSTNPEVLCDMALSALSAIVPPGWQLVPIKPTPEMMRIGYERGAAGFYNEGIWAGMLEVAPSAPIDSSGERNG